VIGIVDACSVQWHLEARNEHSFVGIQIRSGPWCGCPRSVDLLLTPLSQGSLCAVWVALTLHKQQKYGEAEPLLRKLVQQREKVLGAEHVNTLVSKYL
jgi:hypothetical protein